MASYYLLLQTYALRLEAILSAILLLFYAAELPLGVLALVAFSRYRCPSAGKLGDAAGAGALSSLSSFAARIRAEAPRRAEGPSPARSAGPGPRAGDVPTLPTPRRSDRPGSTNPPPPRLATRSSVRGTENSI